MKITMFPRMLASHDEGWVWLTQVHPSVAKMTFFYVLPLSLLAAAMLLYGAATYGEAMGNLSMREAWMIASAFFLVELMAVPVIAAVIQRIGDLVNARPAYHDAYAFAAVVPTPLWLSSLALLIPSLTVNALAMALALFASGLLIFEGAKRVFQQEDEGQSLVLSGAVLAAGLVAWVLMLGLAFVTWGWAISN